MNIDIVLWIAVIGIGVVAYCGVSQWMDNPQGDILGSLEDMAGKALLWSVVLLVLLSLYLSTQFGMLLGDAYGLTQWGALAFFVFAIIQAGLAVHAKVLFTRVQYLAGLGALGGVCLMLAFSFFAGQSFISNEKTNDRQVRIKASDEYQAALQARVNADRRATNAAVSDAAYKQARNDTRRIQAAFDTFMNSIATNSPAAGGKEAGSVRGVIARYGCSGYYGRYCAERDEYIAALNKAGQIIAAHTAYESALSYSNKLKAEPLPNPAEVGNPAFVFAGKLFGVSPDLIEAYGYTLLCMTIDILSALIIWILIGNKRKRLSSDERYTEDGLPLSDAPSARVNKGPIPAMDTGGEILDEGLIYAHSREFVVPEDHADLYKAAVAKSRKCVDCNEVFLPGAHNQIRCAEHSEQSRAKYKATTLKHRNKAA